MADDNSTRRADADDYVTRAGLAAGRKVFGRYVLETELGAGGMGVVWRARDEELSDLVALKFLPEVVARDAAAVDELREETRHALRLTHPNIVRIRNFEREGNVAAVSMEYVDGATLSQLRLEQSGKVFSVEKLAPIATQLCAALDYAHNTAKVVHRDLKPSNVLVTKDGVVKVTDFGIARGLSDTHTRLTGKSTGTSGTLPYMSPQQVTGKKATPADDIYALGATLYELLTGKPPFYTGDITHQILQQAPASLAAQRAELAVENESPATLPPIPPAWEETILACLAKEPQDRPRSAGEVAARLGLAEGEVEGAKSKVENRIGRVDERGRERERVETPTSRMRWFALVATAAIVLGVAGYLFWPRGTGTAAAAPRPAEKSSVTQEPSPKPLATVPPVVRPAATLPREFAVTVDPADAGARLWLGPVSDVAVKEGRAVLKDLPDGEQELVVQAPGYQAFTTRVTVKDGHGSVEAKLVAVRGAVAVTARPGTQVTAVDGRGRETRLGAVPAGGVLDVENLLTLGTYTLRLEHADCVVVTVPGVELVLGRTIKVAPEQTPLPGELRVFSVPTGAEVRVNGAVAGTTPATIKNQPSEQALRLEVFLRGYRRVEQKVTLKPKEVRTVNVGTLVAGAESGSLELRLTNAAVRMADLTILIDGRIVDVRPALAAAPFRLDGLDVGSRTVEIVHPDYEPWRQAVTVRDQEMTAVNVELKPKPGTAVVSASLEQQVFPEPGQAWENTLGMKFAPVPGTGVLFCVWETRVQDFEAFVKDAGYDATGDMYSVGSDGWKQRGNTWRSPGFSQGPTHPVCGVSWDDAKAFCHWLTEKERREGRLGPNQEYRLPTDAEWSVAVGLDEPAGGTPESKDGQVKGVYPWGTQWPPPRGAGNFAGTEVRDGNWPSAWGVIEGYSDGYPRTAPVGSFTANRYGLFDLSGNVWEWCEDYYNGSNGGRVLRGGSFDERVSGHLLSSYRVIGSRGSRRDYGGFRCVVVVSLSEIAGTLPAATSSNPSPPPPASSGNNPDAFGTEAVKLPEPATGADQHVQGDKNTQNNTGSGAKATQALPRPHLAQVRPGIPQQRPVGVSTAGQVAVDAHFSQFGDYLQELIDIVQIQWERILTSSSLSPKSSSHVTISFRINSKGQIAEILKVEGDAGEYGTNAALSALREPAPYRAWTKEMVAVLGDDQVITFSFYYW